MTKPTPFVPTLLPTLLSSAVAVLGLTVLLGWILHIPELVQIPSGSLAMVFNTALCFFLVGIALARPGWLKRPMPKLQMFTSSFVFILCALILWEHLADISMGIDWAFLHTWLRYGNIHPGRLAPNTAIGFMLTAAALIIMNHVTSKWRAFAVQGLTAAILVIGLTGLVGYTLAPDLLFGWARSARMAIPTALGMIMIGVILWLNWHRSEWYQSGRYFQEDEKIVFIGSAILAVVAITTGVMGFVFQQQILEGILKDNLTATLKNRAVLLKTVVEQGEVNTQNASKAFFLQSPPSTDAPATLSKQYNRVVNSLLDNGFQALAVYDLNGKKIASAGQFVDQSRIMVKLQTPMAAKLIWDDGLYLQTEVAIVNQGIAVARLMAQQPLASLDQQLFNTLGLGKTVEIVICTADGKTFLCLPEGSHSTPFRVKRKSALGQPLPMSLAIDGKSGIVISVDYREQNVVAAYMSLAPEVGLVVKEDAAELYSVIRDQLKAMIPVLLFLVMVGAFFLRFQLRPIAARLLASERKAQEKELEIKTLVSSVGEGILTINDGGVIESFNAAASRIFGYSAQEVIGKTITMLMPPAMRPAHEQGMSQYLQGRKARVIGQQGIELQGLKKDGTIFPLALTINEIRMAHRRLFVGIMRDITEQKQIEEKLIFLARNDTLTGLANRTLFMDRLSDASLRANRNRTALGVMFLDLDGFKQINDTLGHHNGDELLKQFATRITETVRKTDTVARLGGDEFTILLEGLTTPELGMETIADKIIAAIRSPFLLDGKAVVVTTSIGLAIHIPGEFNGEKLLRRADSAMYKAKNSGKNCWSMASNQDNS